MLVRDFVMYNFLNFSHSFIGKVLLSTWIIISSTRYKRIVLVTYIWSHLKSSLPWSLVFSRRWEHRLIPVGLAHLLSYLSEKEIALLVKSVDLQLDYTCPLHLRSRSIMNNQGSILWYQLLWIPTLIIHLSGITCIKYGSLFLRSHDCWCRCCNRRKKIKKKVDSTINRHARFHYEKIKIYKIELILSILYNFFRKKSQIPHISSKINPYRLSEDLLPL